MEENRIKNEYKKLFGKNLSKKQRAVAILNVYRNFYYMEGNETDQGIIANAINDILPEYVNKIINEN
jgi:hypothetical protein